MRVIVIFNFTLLCVLAAPPLNSPKVMNALITSSGFELIVVVVQSWFTSSTLFATAFFFYPLARKSSNCESKEVRLGGWFLLVWWLTVVLLVLYALGLGLAVNCGNQLTHCLDCLDLVD